MKWEKAEKERDQLQQTLEKFQNSSKSLNDLLESQVIDKFKTGLGYSAATAASPTVESFVNLSDKSGSDKGYHLVPPPLTGNFIPRKPDLTFMDEIVKSENLDVTTVVTPSNEKTVENKGVFNTVESNTVRREFCALINKELVSDGKKKTVFPNVSKIKFVGPKQPEKQVRKPVKYAKMYRKIQVCDGLGSHKKMIWRILPNRGGKILKLMKITLVQMDAQTQGRLEHDQEFNAEITTVGAKVDDIAAET
ncbi:hypothetical protein Tco_0766481 [Tanacetum coccineum]